MKSDLLIIGKLPPPIGGVTIHTHRLLEHLHDKGIEFAFSRLSLKNLILFPLILLRYRTTHLHTSNIFVQEYIGFITKLYNKKCIITFHGDLNRFNKRDHSRVCRVLKRISVPIVLNQSSYTLAKKINPNTEIVSSFLPPIELEILDESTSYEVEKLKLRCDKVFATNAYALTYDKSNSETYGILDLIYYFNNNPTLGLCISDPSGQYSKYIKENKVLAQNNILLISKHHSFYELLKKVDGSIRNTSTDGDSLSVKESIYLNKVTFATDVVSRPNGTIRYKRGEYDFQYPAVLYKNTDGLSGIDQLIKIYSRT